MMVPAPGRFSMTNGSLSALRSSSPSARVKISVGPPAPHGTIILRLRRRRRREPNHREHDERRDLLKYCHGPARLREKAKGGNWVRTRAELYAIGAGGVQGVEGKIIPRVRNAGAGHGDFAPR